MFNKLLRENNYIAVLLTALRLYLGYSWFTAGLHKLVGGFDAAGYLKGAIAHPVKGPEGDVLFSWYISFLKGFALPHVDFFNFVVPLGETLIGIGLILGCLTTAAAFFGLLMNFAFFLAGTVSHNPIDIFLGFIILTSGYNAGKYGADRWVIPLLEKIVNNWLIKKKNPIKNNVKN